MSDPASPVAQKISDLFWLVTIIAVFVGVGVQVALLLVIRKSRKLKAQDEGGAPEAEEDEHEVPDDGQPMEGVFRPRHYGDTRLEKVLFAITLAAFLGLGFISYLTLTDIEQPDQPVDLEVEITGHQWFWEFYYPEPFNVTEVGKLAELHAPVGATVRIHTTSTDVIHAVWIPDLGVKLDAVPGTINTFWFRAEREGRFLLQCAEYCAGAHSDMHGVVVIESQAAFDAWVAAKQEAARPLPEVPTVDTGVFDLTIEPSGPVPAALDITDGAVVSFNIRNNLSAATVVTFSGPYSATPSPSIAAGASGWLNLTFDTPLKNGTFSCTGCAEGGAFNTSKGARIVEIHLRQEAGSFGMWSIFPEEVKAQPGEVLRFHVFNDAQPGLGTTHNFTLGVFGQEVLLSAEGLNGAAALAPGEDKLSQRFEVPETSKEYWCDVSGHYQLGMRGVLTVEGASPPPPPAQVDQSVAGFEAAVVPLAMLAAIGVAARRRDR